MENSVHVHAFLNFVLILWANYEEKKIIFAVSCGTIRVIQIHVIPSLKKLSKAGH